MNFLTAPGHLKIGAENKPADGEDIRHFDRDLLLERDLCLRLGDLLRDLDLDLDLRRQPMVK